MKTMDQIREVLSRQIQGLEDKTTTPASVNAIVNATGKILTTIKMEMDYAKSLGRTANMDKFIALPPAEKAADELTA